MVRQQYQPLKNTTFLSSRIENFSKISKLGERENFRKLISVPLLIWNPRVTAILRIFLCFGKRYPLLQASLFSLIRIWHMCKVWWKLLLIKCLCMKKEICAIVFCALRNHLSYFGKRILVKFIISKYPWLIFTLSASSLQTFSLP